MTKVIKIEGKKQVVHSWTCEDCGCRIEVISGTGKYTKEHMQWCPNKD